MAEFYSARGWEIPPLPWTNLSPPFSGENVRTQVGDLDPGQDQEPRVLDDKGKVLLAQVLRTSDEVIARGELPRGGAEAEHGERPAVSVMDGIAYLGADQGLVSEIVSASVIL